MNKQKGQMYEWITHTSTHLAGQCPHKCEYCSIQDLQKRFPEQLPYSGPLRLKEKEFAVKYGTGKTIFIENCNDLFADEVPEEWIDRILDHCLEWPGNTYVFQTKNPRRIAKDFFMFPQDCRIGTTVETNRDGLLGCAPPRLCRLAWMKHIDYEVRFVTIEPVMDFDLEVFAKALIDANPAFVNIGADSKGHGLPEPSIKKVSALIDRLAGAGIEIREKHNLERLKI